MTSLPSRHVDAVGLDRIRLAGGLNIAGDEFADRRVHSHINDVDIEAGRVGAARKMASASTATVRKQNQGRIIYSTELQVMTFFLVKSRLES